MDDADVIDREIRVVPDDLSLGRTHSQECQDVGDAHTRTARDRATVHDLRVDDDALMRGHYLRIP